MIREFIGFSKEDIDRIKKQFFLRTINMKTKEGQEIDMKHNLKEYFSFVKNYKIIFFIVLFIVLLIESRHILENYLFKIVIDKGTELGAGTISVPEISKILLIVGIIYISGYIVLGAICRWLSLHFINILESRIIFDMKKKYFDHIISLDHGFHVTHKTGSLISRLSRGARSMERMTDVIVFNFAPLVFQIIILTITLAYLDFTSSIIIVIVILLALVYSIWLQRIQQKANALANQAEDIEKGNVADIFTNIDSIKYFGKENFIIKKFAKLANNTKEATLKHWNFFRWFDAGQTLILSFGTFFIVYFPLMKFLHGEISLGTLSFIYTSYVGLFGPLFSFVHGIREVYRSMADFQDLFEYGKIKTAIEDKSGAKPLKIKEGEVEFKDMEFNYGKRKIFSNFSLKIPEGKKVALVGHSGSGKTTLVKLLYRFYDVNKGEILVDNQNIKDVKQESLRSEMAIVPQECILFDDTIYNNVAFSKPGATREEVLNAINFAQLDKIIKEFPKKENTVVGERGVRLSGGEKQRVSIARAILADKKILVLDEATSSLDSETEHEIKKDLKNLMEGRTSIIIAHRLSTIMSADKIIVLKKGEIVQQGTHEQLIRQSGEYKKLWNLQKGGYIG